MLLAINDRIKGWLGAVVVGLIALPFAFWGIESYIGGGAEQYAAKVNDSEISQRELDTAVARQKQNLQQRFQGKLPFEDVQLKAQMLDQLVNLRLLQNTTLSAGYRISDAELSKNIKQTFSRDGVFDREYFDNVLRSQNLSVSQFQERYRDELRVTQMRSAILGTSLVTREEAAYLASLDQQQREISLITFEVDHFASDVSVGDDEIKAVYETQAHLYMSPETVNVDYVELSSENLASDVPVDEAQIEAMYKAYLEDIAQREQRKARHILLKIESDKAQAEQKLRELKQQLANGTSFESLAKQHSQDPGSAKQGGDLDWVSAGQMVKPFEDALFAMKKGEVSDIVETQFGLHLIKLDDIRGKTPQTLAQKRVEFENELKQDIVSSQFYDLSETLASIAFENPDSLDIVIESMGLELKSSAMFTQDAGTGIAEHKKIREAAFSASVLEQRNNSDAIELAPNHVVVLRIREHVVPSLKPLEQVKPGIEKNLRLKKAQQVTLAAAQSAKQKIESGAALNGVLSEGVRMDKPGVVTRHDRQKIDPSVLEAAFMIQQSEASAPAIKEVELFNGDVALVVLEKILVPGAIEQSKINTVKSQWNQDVSRMEFDALVAALRDSANININSKALE